VLKILAATSKRQKEAAFTMTWVVVGIGGAIGSLMRHGVNVAATHWIGRATPWGTFTVNMIGSFAIGLLAGLIAASRLPMTPTMRLFLFVGIIGGFTTFSSYMLDALTLAHGGQRTAAMLNIGGQVILGYALVLVGYRLGL
jgi:fluoride exporter